MSKTPSKLRQKVYSRDGFKCLKCGSKKKLTIDHVVPQHRWGPTALHNLQTLCEACNAAKGSWEAVSYIGGVVTKIPIYDYQSDLGLKVVGKIDLSEIPRK